jgi:hypothetical protein
MASPFLQCGCAGIPKDKVLGFISSLCAHNREESWPGWCQVFHAGSFLKAWWQMVPVSSLGGTLGALTGPAVVVFLEAV